MKLSAVKGDRVFDVIADIIDPICNIAADEAAGELFKRASLPEGETVNGFILKRAKKAIPPLLRTHKADLIAIFAAIEGVEPAEYGANLDLGKLISDCIDLITDEDFYGLFISAQTGTSSGSAQENTGAGAE